VPPLSRIASLVLAGSVLVLAAGCGGDDQDGPALEGTAWVLIAGVDPAPANPPTLTLAGGEASGFNGCNTYGGGYELDGASITFGELRSTLMACPDAETATERTYMSAIEAVDAWAVENGELVLSTGGEETLRYAPE
jgi:heat shock protein HslJ